MILAADEVATAASNFWTATTHIMFAQRPDRCDSDSKNDDKSPNMNRVNIEGKLD